VKCLVQLCLGQLFPVLAHILDQVHRKRESDLRRVHIDLTRSRSSIIVHSSLLHKAIELRAAPHKYSVGGLLNNQR